MIDYAFIGQRLRKARLAKGMTQEQLAAAVDVGTTHISHIETGNTIASTKTILDIINVLECSADEIFCLEVQAAKAARSCWLTELVADCSADETKVIADTVTALKDSLRRNK